MQEIRRDTKLHMWRKSLTTSGGQVELNRARSRSMGDMGSTHEGETMWKIFRYIQALLSAFHMGIKNLFNKRSCNQFNTDSYCTS